MTSTSYSVGMSLERNSSRVLKPPGGGQTSIFGGNNEVAADSPRPKYERPKYDQQNSSNLNFCMNTNDPSLNVEQTKQVVETAPQQEQQQHQKQKHSDNDAKEVPTPNPNKDAQQNSSASKGGRVPPGGFSSGGFW